MNNVITSGPVLPFSTTDENWFPVRITSVLGPTTYTFQEVWLTDSGLSIADRIGGNSNSSTDPAYAIDGSTFSVTAAGSAVQVLARRAPGLGGAGWELKGFSSTILKIQTVGLATTLGVSPNFAVLWSGGLASINDPATTATVGRGAMCWSSGWIDRTGTTAIDVRIGLTVSASFTPVAGDPIYGEVNFRCPSNVKTAWATSGFVPLQSGANRYFGVCVEAFDLAGVPFLFSSPSCSQLYSGIPGTVRSA